MAVLKRGSRGDDVKKLQQLLNEKGNYGLDEDGVFGGGTEDAVEDFQRKNGLEVDGKVGPATMKALENYAPQPASALLGAAAMATNIGGARGNSDYANENTWDPKSDERILSIHQDLQGMARELVNRLDKEHGIKVRVVFGFRSYKQQNELYAKGRTTQQLEDAGIKGIDGRPDKGKVTNARGGYSFHNFGLAIDVVEIAGGKALWKNDNWETIGKVGESIGWEWGGRWTSFVDKPHFQVTNGHNTRALRAANPNGIAKASEVKMP